MGRDSAIVCVAGLMLVAAIAAQEPRTAPPKTPAALELTGCISGDPGASGSFTFLDATSGGRYRLTGKSVRKYAGRMVHLVGGPQGKGLSVRGGLWPSPNVAAQAGAIDPTQAVIARVPGGTGAGTGGNELPEFRVASVRRADGSCGPSTR